MPDVIVLGDVGSTFTKVVCVTTEGDLISAATAPTPRRELAGGFATARAAVLRELAGNARIMDTLLTSSAAGGLRLVVVGLEPSLTVQAGLRVAATAGARVVATYAGAELGTTTAAELHAPHPDLVLLTGGTNGGDERSLLGNAHALRELAPELPVVVAGNESAYDRVRAALGGQRLVRFTGNVLPRIGVLDASGAQAEIRALFSEHVIGRGRHESFAALRPATVRMPTPAAVLSGLRVVAGLGGRRPRFARPIAVDVGGATTDVHSVLPVRAPRGFVRFGVPAESARRTVEGDLGLRENAPHLLTAARRDGVAEPTAELAAAAERRAAVPAFLPDDPDEARVDRQLAELATAIAVERHAGRVKVRVDRDGAVLEQTGRDLRPASCAVATGGIFRQEQGESVLRAGLQRAERHGALVRASIPLVVDRAYVLWAVGLLHADHPPASRALADRQLGPGAGGAPVPPAPAAATGGRAREALR